MLESDDFDFGNVAANINKDIVDASFSLLDVDVNTLFESDTLGSLFRTNSGEGALVRQTAAAAFNATEASINGVVLQENDNLSSRVSKKGTAGKTILRSVFLHLIFVGAGNWFETVFSDGGEGNLLASLENPIYDLQSEFYIQERRWGIDQNGYVPLGTFESVGQGTGLTTETSGSSEQSALLPDADTTVDGGFAFEVAIEEIVNEEGIVWIDPDIATGYVYQATQT